MAVLSFGITVFVFGVATLMLIVWQQGGHLVHVIPACSCSCDEAEDARVCVLLLFIHSP